MASASHSLMSQRGGGSIEPKELFLNLPLQLIAIINGFFSAMKVFTHASKGNCSSFNLGWKMLLRPLATVNCSLTLMRRGLHPHYLMNRIWQLEWVNAVSAKKKDFNLQLWVVSKNWGRLIWNKYATNSGLKLVFFFTLWLKRYMYIHSTNHVA